MTYRFSSPAADLFSQYDPTSSQNQKIDTLIVGSGYGAAMAALALAEKNNNQQHRIVVLEKGDEYLPEDFPRGISDVFPNIGIRTKTSVKVVEREENTLPTTNRLKHLWDVRSGDGAITITGSGLGGTSLVNASVVLRPEDHVLEDWPLPEKQTPWSERLSPYYEKIEQLLGVETTPNVERFAKYRALQSTVTQLDNQSQAFPAPVSIDFNANSQYSVEHDKCNYCGNCVTGCHSGAKQSLNLNAWPLAAQLGVELFTGVTVDFLKQNPDQDNANAEQTQKWVVQVRSTRNLKEVISIQADRVILAAGTLGSTSILHRSKTLDLSDQLGKRFSVNGDTVKFGVGQKERVNAVADAPEKDSLDPPGPTITGVGQIRMGSGSDKDKLIIEDGAMPFALSDVWNEMLATQSLISEFAGDERSQWHKQNSDHDPLAISSGLADHSQVFLTMGHDKGYGELIPDKNFTATHSSHDEGELLPAWDATKDTFHKNVQALFEEAGHTAFDGGVPHPNPVWRMIPPKVAEMIEGADIPGSVVSVHPLGGCIMGLDVGSGVVNCRGQVFNANPANEESVYDDLYVLDAAIIPTAVGANPLLTISALAYALACEIPLEQTDSNNFRPGDAFPLLSEASRRMPPRTRIPAIPREKIRTEAIFRERLFWDLTEDKRPTSFLIERLKAVLGEGKIPEDTKVVILDIAFEFNRNNKNEDTSLEAWVQRPNVELTADAAVRVSSAPLLHTSEDIVVPDEPILRLTGEVNLGNTSDAEQYKASTGKLAYKLNTYFHAAQSMGRYFQFRWIDVVDKVLNMFKKDEKNENKSVWTTLKSLPNQIAGYWRFALIHSRWHYLDYRLRSTDEHTGPSIHLAGRKKLAYQLNGDTLWDSLTKLPMVLTRQNEGVTAVFGVDLIRMANGPAPLQVTNANNTPHAVISTGQVVAYFVRTLAKTHFWSLGALHYKRYPERKEIDDDRLEEPPKTVTLFNTEQVGVRQNVYEYDNLARLVHYSISDTDTTGETSTSRPSIMLTHGLAHGTRLFWTTDTRENYLQFFLRSGFDVWLLDHRASANYRRTVDSRHSVDSLAEDVKWAVTTIFALTNNRRPDEERPKRVHVLAHCVGAAATSIAALKGDLQQSANSHESMLASFALHAVAPWLYGSAENRSRQNIWWFIDNSSDVTELDSNLHNKPKGAEILFDRISHSMMSDEDRRHWGFFSKLRDPKGIGYTKGVYSRYRFFYGPEFNFFNVSKKMRKRFQLHAGVTPLKSVKQMFISVVGQRIVNSEAENNYLTAENLAEHWQFPTLYYHGHDNKVFDIESSRMSAYSLARFRKNRIEGNEKDISTSEYNQYGVQLKTLANYGHMDMIFGEQATNDIGPDILNFLMAAEQQANAGSPDNDYQAFAKALEKSTNEALPEELPISSRIPERLPSAGPVLSHVNKNSIRLWLESDDYNTQKINHVNINSLSGPVSKTTLSMPSPSKTVEQHSGRFWLFELNDPEKIQHAVGVSVSNKSSVPPMKDWLLKSASINELPDYEQADQPKTKPFVTNFSTMPWFKREFGQHTIDEPQAIDLSVAIGSCLHPGTTIERRKSDSIFRGIWQHAVGENSTNKSSDPIANHSRELDLMLLLGDQIYADATAEIFDSTEYYERYRKRYRSAWNGTWMRRVMSHLPTHFVVDDHEFHDDFSGDSTQSEIFNIERATFEANSFQIHLPASERSKPESDGLQFWHSFERLDVPFFCFDTRFERNGDKNGSLGSLFGDSLIQWHAFIEWLSSKSDSEVLVLASGSPLCPVEKNIIKHPKLAAQSDSLLAYPEFLNRLVLAIDAHCPNASVIWLAGDPHFSSVANVTIETQGKHLHLTSITASGLYAALPFANSSTHNYRWDSKQTLNLQCDYDINISFTQSMLSDAHQQFSKLDFDLKRKLISIASYGPDGLPLCDVKALKLKGAAAIVA